MRKGCVRPPKNRGMRIARSFLLLAGVLLLLQRAGADDDLTNVVSVQVPAYSKPDDVLEFKVLAISSSQIFNCVVPDIHPPPTMIMAQLPSDFAVKVRATATAADVRVKNSMSSNKAGSPPTKSPAATPKLSGVGPTSKVLLLAPGFGETTKLQQLLSNLFNLRADVLFIPRPCAALAPQAGNSRQSLGCAELLLRLLSCRPTESDTD